MCVVVAVDSTTCWRVLLLLQTPQLADVCCCCCSRHVVVAADFTTWWPVGSRTNRTWLPWSVSCWRNGNRRRRSTRPCCQNARPRRRRRLSLPALSPWQLLLGLSIFPSPWPCSVPFLLHFTKCQIFCTVVTPINRWCRNGHQWCIECLFACRVNRHVA